MTPIQQPQDLAQRRSAARRTAFWVGAVAVAVYVLFILGGVFGFGAGR
ncbi:hypothetical protein ACI2IY_24600 [Lysobacter enzymogenes]